LQAIRACQAAPAAGDAAAVEEPAAEAAAAGGGNVTAGAKDPVCESAMVLCSLTQVRLIYHLTIVYLSIDLSIYLYRIIFIST
jgi:hypothetical protein